MRTPADRVIPFGPSRQAALWAVRSVAALAVAAAWTLLARRLGGAFGAAPSAPVLIAAGIATVGAAIAIRLTARKALRSAGERRAWEIAASAAVWPVAFALSLPGAPPWAVAALWLAALAEEAWGWSSRRVPIRTRPSPQASVAVLKEAIDALEEVEEPDEEGPILQEGVCQQITRTAADGVETLEALVRVHFERGARTAAAHVAFCPPFPAVPECEAEVVEGAACRVKITQLQPYGIRLELKLLEPAEELCEAVIGIEARSQKPGVRSSEDEA